MAQLLIALPDGTAFDQFTPLQLTHPKGSKCTFLLRESRLYELNHHLASTNMCFATSGARTTIKTPEVLQLSEFDVMFIVLPALEASKERGKVNLDDLDLESAKRLKPLLARVKWDAFCETSTVDETLYVRLDEAKLNVELERRHKRLLQAIEKNGIMSEQSQETQTYHAAKAICDCLMKKHEISFLAHLKLDDRQVDDVPPPAKKAKQSNGTAAEPLEDYSGKENVAIGKPVDAKKEAHQKKMKSAAKGTKSLMSFFTPKKK